MAPYWVISSHLPGKHPIGDVIPWNSPSVFSIGWCMYRDIQWSNLSHTQLYKNRIHIHTYRFTLEHLLSIFCCIAHTAYNAKRITYTAVRHGTTFNFWTWCLNSGQQACVNFDVVRTFYTTLWLNPIIKIIVTLQQCPINVPHMTQYSSNQNGTFVARSMLGHNIRAFIVQSRFFWRGTNKYCYKYLTYRLLISKPKVIQSIHCSILFIILNVRHSFSCCDSQIWAG